MDYEKAYKDALGRAKKVYHRGYYISGDIESIFPELKESEDERIRKSLIILLQHFCKGYRVPGLNFPVSYKDMLAWLEKQGEQKINLVEILKHYPKETELYSSLYGKLWLAEVDEENEIITCYKHPLNKGCTRAILGQEDTISFYSDGTIGLPDFSVSKDCMLFLYDIEKQGKQKSQGKLALEAANEEKVDNQNCVKSTDKIEPKFKVGDWITNGATKPAQISSIEDDMYYTHNGTIGGDIESMDKDYHLWTIADAKEGDVLYFSDNTIVIFKDLYSLTTFHSYCHIEDGVFDISKDDMPDWWEGKGFHPATKEQRDLLFSKMKEAGYEWDEEKKELKKIEQKPTQETKSFEVEHGKYYYCIKDYFCGGKKQASKGDVIQALRGLPIMGLKDASEYFLPVNSIKEIWSEDDKETLE